MYIKEISIEDFRAFKGGNPTKIPLSKNITVLTGHNGVGKSTILAILCNCGELKKKYGTHLNGTAFRGDFPDIIKYDPTGDTSGEKVILTLGQSNDDENLVVSTLSYRAAIQSPNRSRKATDSEDDSKEPSKRLRLIPKPTEQRKTEAKLVWPTYYLGLSRLYPAGESVSVSETNIKFDEELLEEYQAAYCRILGFKEKDLEPKILRLSDVPKKRGISVATANYGSLANSAGQDNLGQILAAVLSFRKLKEERDKRREDGNNSNEEKESFSGGLLAIDEIDATLHPAAQTRLYYYLLEQSRKLDLQIVFTTHSTSLMELMYSKNHIREGAGTTQLYYLNRSSTGVEVTKPLTFEEISNKLKSEMVRHDKPKKVGVLVEDGVAATVLNVIAERYGDCKLFSRIEINSVSKGAEETCKIVSTFPEKFYDTFVVLDPDKSESQERKKLRTILRSPFHIHRDDGDKGGYSVLFLPGKLPIELELWEMVQSLEEYDYLFECEDSLRLNCNYDSVVIPYTQKWVKAKKCDLDAGKSEEHDGYGAYTRRLEFSKNWFRKLPPDFVPILVDRWLEYNGTEVDRFIEDFIGVLDQVESRVKI